MGWDSSNIENESGNTATYYDKQGNVVAEKLSDITARYYLAQQEALEKLFTSAQPQSLNQGMQNQGCSGNCKTCSNPCTNPNKNLKP
jgi:YD repeat-containing protein